MKHGMLCAAMIGLAAGQAAWADLTMRYTLDFQFGSFLPPSAVDAMKAQFGELPKDTLVLVKGDKVYTSMGRLLMVADYAKGVITLMDPKGRRFAVSPMAAYAEKLAAAQKLPPMPLQMQQMFENIKFDVKTAHTGQTATIHGLRGEEDLVTVSVEIPNAMGSAMQMRMEMHQWHVPPDAINRMPVLKEMTAYGRLPKAGMDPVELVTKALAGFPALAAKLRAPMEELAKNGGNALLRMRTAIFMPSLAQMAGGAADQPFTEYTMELADLSMATVPDARFEVPADYQSAPMEELIATLFPSPKPTLPSAGSRAAVAPARPAPPPPGVYRVGNGVTPPHVLSQTQPGYTEEARAARLQGSVLLNVIVGADGTAQQVRVLRSLDPGLDQKAVETVGAWTFQPGMKDGKPVAVEAQIEVSFHLME